LFEFIDEIVGDFAWVTSIEDAIASAAMTIEF
jgi:hypothetical protein